MSGGGVKTSGSIDGVPGSTAGARPTRSRRAARETPAAETLKTAQPDESASDAEAATTRDRILEVALDLFNRKGYAETSMREIAAPLRISKAALYYHFPSKADIMLELHLRMHRLAEDLHDIPGPGADDRAWRGFLDQIVTLALRNRRLLELHFRNQELIQGLHSGALLEKHTDSADEGLETQMLALVMDRTLDPETRVRRIGSLGVVMAILFGSVAVGDIPDEQLEPMIASITERVLEPR
jgi:AcrR family transcriptional regulator